MPTVAQTLGTRVRRLLELLDGDVASLYREAGLDYRPRYTPVMRVLLREGESTIGELAARSGLTQPAVSQTVAQMARDGLVSTRPTRDRRVRNIGLTDKGEAMRDALERQWAATLEAAGALDAELPAPLSGIVAEAIDRLEARPFAGRVRDAMEAADRAAREEEDEA